jgi:hypothetical protein
MTISPLLQQAYKKEFRPLLRALLLERRGLSRSNGHIAVECGVCHTLIDDADQADMHEALMTRGHVQTQPEFSYLVFHGCNVVFRHKTCPGDQFKHEGGVGGEEIFERCAKQLVRYEGYDNVAMWLLEMSCVFVQTGGDAYRRFQALDLSREEKIFEIEGGREWLK